MVKLSAGARLLFPVSNGLRLVSPRRAKFDGLRP